MTKRQVLKKLKQKANPKNLAGMARFGIETKKRFGTSMPDIRKIAKEIGKDHALALELFDTGWAEAKIISAFIAEPDKLTERQMDKWVTKYNSWDEVDQSMGLFARTPFAEKKVFEWAGREEEFVKRSAFVIIAVISLNRFDYPSDYYKRFYSIIKLASTDERNYVKKAVNWAIRQMGKRNLTLNKEMIKLSKQILNFDNKTARWIANDALRELTNKDIIKRLINKQSNANA